MYIFKNAILNISRCKGRNVLIGIIICVITIGACIALSIYHSGTNLVENYHLNNPIEVQFQVNTMSFRGMDEDEREAIKALSIEEIKIFGAHPSVVDYYYTLEASLSSDDIEPINYNDMFSKQESPRKGNGKFEMPFGDFRLTAYSNSAYIRDFEEGSRKMIEGSMVNEESAPYSIVISEELALENDLQVGDTVTFHMPEDSKKTYSFTITGIFQDENEIESTGFFNMNAMNTRNQIFTTMETLLEIVDVETTSSMFSNNLNAVYYLSNQEDVESFYEDAKAQGLPTYYQISTNEESVQETLRPIQNITSFSLTFLIVVFLIGAIVLSVLHMMNIRERKYEIGVLRAIGMSKGKVSLQLISEIFFVSFGALLFGVIIGSFLAQPISNQMLKNEKHNRHNEKKTLADLAFIVLPNNQQHNSQQH